MLILLPPSEGKTPARRGRPMSWDDLSAPELTDTRRRLAGHLARLSADPARAMAVLDLTPGQAVQLEQNLRLDTAPATRADRLYTGVLYDALGLTTLSPPAKRRAARSVLITSALYGWLRPGDRVAPYRMSGAVSLPGLGPVAATWRDELGPVAEQAAGRGPILDLRSQTYVAFARLGRELRAETITVRVLLERDGRRSIVSHVNKATKGRLARSLLEVGAAPRTAAALIGDLRDLGWRVETDATRLDVVVDHL